MKRYAFIALLLLSTACRSTQSNPHAQTQSQIDSFIRSKKADIGLAVIGPEKDDTFFYNADRLFTMMSVIKFPQAVGLLHLASNGKLNLDSIVYFDSSTLNRPTWSPLAEEHPEGDFRLSIADCFKYSVAKSDNIVCDQLYDFMSIPALQKFYNENGFSHLNFKFKYRDMNPDSIAGNNSSPRDMARLLKDFNTDRLCNNQHKNYLLTIMRNTETGPKRLKGMLPGISIAHKTGTYFEEDSFINALNDVGIVELKDKTYYIAVFVNNSLEGQENTEAIIAQLNKMVYDYFRKKYGLK